jgi:hypothetical protein
MVCPARVAAGLSLFNMPIVRDVYNNFVKQYGAGKGKEMYFRWENARPKQYQKGLSTARKRGSAIMAHAPNPKRSIGKRSRGR